MKLLFAIKSLNVVGGGAERVLVDVANGMAARGHAIQVLTFDRPGESFYHLDPRIARIDTGIGEPGKPTPRKAFFKNILRVRQLVQREGADLVIAFMHSTYVPLRIALLGAGQRVVFSEHIDAAHYADRTVQRLLVRFLERLAVAKTVPSAPLHEEHRGAFRSRVHVVPNAVDVESFAKAGSQDPATPPVVLCIGRFMTQKNHIELLQAFARLAPRFPAWSLKIVGEGELRPELEAEIIRLGLQDRVALPGVTRDVLSEYAAASFVVLPSLYESFGLVAAEALASSRPVLALDSCVGIAEMVRSETNGLLVPAAGDRVTNLALGLERLMADPDLRARLGAAGPESVKRYALDGVLDAWEALFTRLQPQGHENALAPEPGRGDDRLLRPRMEDIHPGRR